MVAPRQFLHAPTALSCGSNRNRSGKGEEDLTASRSKPHTEMCRPVAKRMIPSTLADAKEKNDEPYSIGVCQVARPKVQITTPKSFSFEELFLVMPQHTDGERGEVVAHRSLRSG